MTISWLLICIGVVSLLLSQHYITFNPSEYISKLSQKIIFDSGTEKKSKWTLHHILGAGCGCSETVFSYLKSRGPQSDLNEAVTVVGADKNWASSLRAVGFKVQLISENELNADEMLGVPYLAIYNEQNDPIYQGGYGEHFIKKNEDVLDLQILKSLKGHGKTAHIFPIFGCAASLKYKKILDPFNQKYEKAEKL